MKNKHRRQFKLNNRYLADFYFPLRKVKKTALLSLVAALFTMLSMAPLALSNAQTAAEQSLSLFLDQTLTSVFAKVNETDRSVKITSKHTHQRTCQEPIDFKWRGQVKAGKNTLAVSCSNPFWQHYISVYFEIFDKVVIAATPLERSHPLTQSSLSTQRLDISTLKLGYFTERENLHGYLLQRTVKSGQVITPYIVKAPALIKRGDWVTIVTGRTGLTVTAKGEALKDGVLGEQITVKNLMTQTNIKAWVVKKGLVATKHDLI